MKTFVKIQYITKKGYVRIYRGNGKWELEHRLIYKQYYNCSLLSITQLHHKDKNKQNNFINNLECRYRYSHEIDHYIDMSARVCFLCGVNSSLIRKDGNKREHWYKHNNNFICHKCNCKLNYNKRKELN